MKPLTDTTPKPLLRAGRRPLIEYTIESLADAGISDLVINLAYLGGEIEAALEDGRRFGINIRYSHEGQTGLETGGGIFQALPLLGDGPFIVVNGDIYSNFPFRRLIKLPIRLAHLVLVPNPAHNRVGDFILREDGTVCNGGGPTHTFSGIGIYRRELFEGCSPGKFRLAPLLQRATKLGEVSGELYRGFWIDVGTVQRLEYLDKKLTELRRS